MKENLYPNLIVCGAPKCGTSSLYFWLAAHPQVGASKAKETFYFADQVNRFNKGCNYLEDGLEKYPSHFAHLEREKVRFEATAPYIYYDTAIRGIGELPETPRLIFVLRNPVKRLMSQYLFEKFRTQRIASDFAEYVKEPEIVAHGEYANYLKKWYAAFPAENMLLLQFEQLMAEPERVMEEVAAWLGVSPGFYGTFNFDQRNETVKIKSKGFHQLGLRLQRFIPHGLQRLLLPVYLKFNSGGKPKASAQDLEHLEAFKEHYAPFNNELKLLWPQLDLNLWK